MYRRNFNFEISSINAIHHLYYQLFHTWDHSLYTDRRNKYNYGYIICFDPHTDYYTKRTLSQYRMEKMFSPIKCIFIAMGILLYFGNYESKCAIGWLDFIQRINY